MARFEEVVNIHSQPVDTGAAQSFQALANTLEQFEQVQSQLSSRMIGYAGELAVKRGKKRARETTLETDEDGITKPPKLLKERFIGSIEIDAHNKALRAAYVASLSNEIREGVSKIRDENPDDLVKFNELAGSFAQGILKTVEPGVREIVIADLDQQITHNRIAVQRTETERNHKVAHQELTEAAKKTVDAAKLAARKGDSDLAESELVKLSFNLQSQVDSKFLTEPQARKLFRDAKAEVVTESTVGKIREYTDSGKFSEAIKGIERVRKSVPKGMTIDEHDGLVNSIIADVNQSLALSEKLDNIEKQAFKDNQLQNFNSRYVGILTGETMSVDIVNDLRAGRLDQNQASELVSALNRRGHGVDDWSLVTEIQEEIRNNVDKDIIRRKIANNSGLNLTEHTANQLIESLYEYEKPESVLKESRVKRARNFITPHLRTYGSFGQFDTKGEKRIAESIRIFDERVLNGDDPWTVADELVDYYELEDPKIGGGRGDKYNLEDAEKRLDEKALKGEITEELYNQQMNYIRELKIKFQNMTEFKKALKEERSKVKNNAE